ncbi:hypothetical protein [Burkholderia sp. BCC1972]|uniref:hypothetical protein n=1 Tax=Burkholderia sp. BCC1972 TaxID=2817438 RepID=UPI002ABD6269|nr:hypothetical protein [Burkholderia sp. BCC1972]
MKTLQDLEGLVATLEHTAIVECVYTAGDQTIRLEFDRPARTDRIKNPEPPGAGPSADLSRSRCFLRAPCSGHFARTHPLLDRNMAVEDTEVAEGQHVAYIEVDSVFFPVVAPFRCELGKMSVVDGERIGYGTALVEITHCSVA